MCRRAVLCCDVRVYDMMPCVACCCILLCVCYVFVAFVFHLCCVRVYCDMCCVVLVFVAVRLCAVLWYVECYHMRWCVRLCLVYDVMCVFACF